MPPEEVLEGANELHESDAVSAAMAAAGGLVLLRYVSDLPVAISARVARRVFCAMRGVEARLSQSGHSPDA